jgi:hypothetical protein
VFPIDTSRGPNADGNGRKTHVKRSPDSDDRDMPNRADEDPKNAAAEEREIDQILADSFPASDAPPWTLGVRSRSSSTPSRRAPGGRVRSNDA